MKVRFSVDVDTKTGEYSVGFNNISDPGESIDYSEVHSLLKKVFQDLDRTIESSSPVHMNDDTTFKSIN